MAVRQGYGKIAGTDALAFAYDTGDTRNSYRGEPTTNLLSNVDDWSSNWTGNLFNNWINATVTPNADYAPDGTLTASKLTGGYSRYQRISCTTNTTYTFSVWLKNLNLGVDPTLRIAFGLNGSLVSYNTATTISRSTIADWRRVSITFTSPSSGINQMEVGVEYSGDYPNSNSILVWHAMCEQKTHVTSFTAGTRSSTQGLLDITGNSTIDISPTSFNSNAEIEYDGSNDYITTQSKTWPFPNGGTVEQVVKPVTLNREQGFFTLNPYGGTYINFWMPTSNTMRWEVIGTTSQGYSTINTITAFQTGQYYHVVGTFDGSTTKVYLNGVLEASQNMSNQPTSVTCPLEVGRYSSSYPCSAQIPVTKVYNRPLTADEVRNNYNQYRTRFNI